MKYRDIPQYTRYGYYVVNNPISHMLSNEKNEGWLDGYIKMGLQLDPEFQRGNVWTEEQQIKYIEYRLKGGRHSGRNIYFNKPDWMSAKIYPDNAYNDFVCVDGLQRITAAIRYMKGEIKIFDKYTVYDFEDSIPIDFDFITDVNNLQTYREVLQWYVDLNEGGTVHTTEELNRVKDLVKKEIK